MHKIFNDGVMKDKADAIREVCKLPETFKMKPPEMGDILLQNYNPDPGLVFELNNYSTEYSGESIDAFNFMHFSFDQSVSGLDFDIYKNLEITFNIKELSHSFANAYTQSELNNFLYVASGHNLCENFPGVELLYANPSVTFQNTQSWNPGYTNKALVSVYQNDETGVCYLFGKYRRYNTSTDYTDRGAYIEHIIENAENKDIKIVFDKAHPNLYSVFSNDILEFTDERVSETENWGDLRFWPNENTIKCVSIGSVMYKHSGSDVNNYIGFGHTPSDAARKYPWDYNRKYDISFNHILMKYSK